MTEGEAYRLERQISKQYRIDQIAITAKFCPTCGMRIGPYGCDICNGVRMGHTLNRLDCPICGGKQTRRPDHTKMSGMWWMGSSRGLTRICDECMFVGTILEFETEAFRRSMGNQSPDVDMNTIDEIPY